MEHSEAVPKCRHVKPMASIRPSPAHSVAASAPPSWRWLCPAGQPEHTPITQQQPNIAVWLAPSGLKPGRRRAQSSATQLMADKFMCCNTLAKHSPVNSEKYMSALSVVIKKCEQSETQLKNLIVSPYQTYVSLRKIPLTSQSYLICVITFGSSYICE